MNKNSGLIIVVLAIVFIAVAFYSSMNTGEVMMSDEIMEQGIMVEDSMMDGQDAMMEEEATTMMGEDVGVMTAGSYEAYAPEKVARASSSNNVVLFFRANWCPTCRALDTDIRANLSKIPSNLTILDINYDDSTSLKQRYLITYQHTFVQVDMDGNLIKKWSGSPTLSALVSEIK